MIQSHFLVTSSLSVRRALAEDAPFIHGLWTSPEVMCCVGFPKGLDISIDAIREHIQHSPDSNFGSLLIAESRKTGARIGQCKIGSPDSEGICEPDIKLLPAFWGRGYGRELWSAMIDYVFQNSAANIVQGTPNRDNIPSVRMQMGVGMIKVDEGVFRNHPSPHPGAVPVPYFKLQITRRQWPS